MVLRKIDMPNKTQKAKLSSAINSHPTGRGLRPAFEALWHLEELKVIKDLACYSSKAWDVANACRPPVVVVMDTPMDINHPNLAPNIDRARMRDFSVYNDGAFPVDYDTLNQEEKKARNALASSLLAALESHQHCDKPESVPIDPIIAITNTVLSEIKVGELEKEAQKLKLRSRQTLVTQLPGAHGTAVAGLIAGVPATEELQSAAYLGARNQLSTTTEADLPYAGINPFAKIIPISLTAAPYADMVLGALTYIAAIKPDIVIIAAAWADTVDLNGAQPEDNSWPMELNEKQFELPVGEDADDNPTSIQDSSIWTAVTDKIKSLSHNSVVLCAAGNVDTDRLVYPANLCSEPDNNIWAVTACDVDGDKLSYAPRVQTESRMIKTLSTQLPGANQGETVVDPYEIILPELDVNHIAPKHVTARDIITLDPTGRQGYNPTDHPSSRRDSGEPLLEIGSLYARFSGTSAATAIAGGLVSLALSMAAAEPIEISPDQEKLFDLDQARALFGPHLKPE